MDDMRSYLRQMGNESVSEDRLAASVALVDGPIINGLLSCK
jgi:hypothetical protein